MPDDVSALVHPPWPPLAHVQRGWDAISPSERDEVRARLDALLAGPVVSPSCSREAAARFFAFLAQVETIAIEIPLRFLPHVDEGLRPTLRRQLVDEVFHSTLFARIAHDLAAPAAAPPPPVASAERLLEHIRTEPDLAVGATLLNLVAEGWVETIFRHARAWGVADAAFAAVLEDESRHVEEADLYRSDLDPQRARDAVARLEQGLLEVSREPGVALAIADLAGHDGHLALVRDLRRTHREHLARVGLRPGTAWQEQMDATHRMLKDLAAQPRAEPVPDTPWRVAARRVWDTPRDPTMQGDMDLPVGRVPKRLLTPVLVAAVGRAWARHPELNRVVAKDRVWQLPTANVGVRVLVDEGELATVVITEADRRSVRDIARMLQDGVEQLRSARAAQRRQGVAVEPFDDRLLALADPGAASFAVALSNPGKFGLVRGAGAFSGAVAPSTDISVGQRRRLPTWRGVAYLPAWHVNLGCLQDHRLFDGREAGVAMQAVRAQLTRRNLRAILRAPDTLPSDREAQRLSAGAMAMPPELRMLSTVGFTKYLPLALGGVGLGVGVGVGTYFLVQHLAAGAAGAAGPAGAGASAGASAGGAGGEARGSAPTPGPGTCAGTTAGGAPCGNPAGEGGYCRHHGGS